MGSIIVPSSGAGSRTVPSSLNGDHTQDGALAKVSIKIGTPPYVPMDSGSMLRAYLLRADDVADRAAHGVNTVVHLVAGLHHVDPSIVVAGTLGGETALLLAASAACEVTDVAHATMKPLVASDVKGCDNLGVDGCSCTAVQSSVDGPELVGYLLRRYPGRHCTLIHPKYIVTMWAGAWSVISVKRRDAGSNPVRTCGAFVRRLQCDVPQGEAWRMFQFCGRVA